MADITLSTNAFNNLEAVGPNVRGGLSCCLEVRPHRVSKVMWLVRSVPERTHAPQQCEPAHTLAVANEIHLL
jgi:hypothetical protein